MICDFHEGKYGEVLHADVCIIGSGAAGIAAAREFIGTAYSVLLLEGGGSTFEEASQEPYQSRLLGLSHNGIHSGRVRVLGGTTTQWAGQAMPLLDIDFRERDWVPYSGWPFSKEALLPYYRRAEQVMQIPAATYNAATWPQSHIRPPAYEAGKIVPFYSQFASVPDFARKYRQELQMASNITVLTHANVVALEANEDASALREARIRSFQRHEARVKARYFLVCCGGIETARLLLVSNSREPNGVGNSHDVVGRFFQDHPGVSIQVTPLDRKNFGLWFNSFRKENIKYALKITASEEVQQQQRLLNVGAEVYYPQEKDGAILASKQLLQAIRNPRKWSQVPKALAVILRQPNKVVRTAYRHYLLKQPAIVGSVSPHLGFGVEQEPNPSSRVTLDDALDSLGVRRAALDWRLTGAETRTIEIFARTVAEEWRRLGIADIDLSQWQLAGRERGEHGGFIDAFHHIGTTRMGTNPQTSVVDAHCRVHGYDNLYIGSSAVFPTSGFSNPTLTLIALTLRVADEIKDRLSHPLSISTDVAVPAR